MTSGPEAQDLGRRAEECAATELAGEEVRAANREREDLPGDDAPRTNGKETLHTARRIVVPVLEEDKAIIQAKARALRLSAASYLRNLGLGFEPASTLDSHAVRELAKINGDQGRLGGLLKLWLTDDEKFREFADSRGVRSDVLVLLQQLGEMQKQLQAVMHRLVDGSARP